MSSAKEIAAQVLPHFAAGVLAGSRRSYGEYAHLIGRDVAKESIVIGQAMHLIGALCVFRRLPVAPLFYVKRSDGEVRQVFASDPTESFYVLPHIDTLLVAAREYSYAQSDFDGIAKGLQEVMLEKAPPDWSPHHMWHLAVSKKPKDSEQTYFERALATYEAFIQEKRTKRKERG